MKPETIKMGKRGTVVIPNHMRKAMNLEEGDLLIAEMREDGLMLLPAVAVPAPLPPAWMSPTRYSPSMPAMMAQPVAKPNTPNSAPRIRSGLPRR